MTATQRHRRQTYLRSLRRLNDEYRRSIDFWVSRGRPAEADALRQRLRENEARIRHLEARR